MAIRGHVETFDEYVLDAKTFVEKMIKKNRPPGTTYVLLAHSMGGQIALRYLQQYPQDFNAAVLSSPFVGLNGSFGRELLDEIKDTIENFKKAFLHEPKKSLGVCHSYTRGVEEFIRRLRV